MKVGESTKLYLNWTYNLPERLFHFQYDLISFLRSWSASLYERRDRFLVLIMRAIPNQPLGLRGTKSQQSHYDCEFLSYTW